jgi:hypothetical protein
VIAEWRRGRQDSPFLVGTEEVMAKTKVFISFDFDNDETLKDFLVGQSKLEDSPFELADWSIKEALTGN